jgi:hypothetical protein
MGAGYETILIADIPPEKLRNVIRSVIQDIQERHPRFQIEHQTVNITMLRSGLNWLSWGERIIITAEHKSIRVVSECILSSQGIDWGRNRNNVELIRPCLAQAINTALGEYK